MKKTILLGVVLTGLLASAAVARPSEQGEAAVLKYTATMLGSNEVPPGDPTAVGFAVVTVDTTANTVSWVILSPDLTNVNASHIHEGPAGVAAGVVIPFNQPFTNGVSSGTATVSAAIIGRLVANPAN